MYFIDGHTDLPLKAILDLSKLIATCDFPGGGLDSISSSSGSTHELKEYIYAFLLLFLHSFNGYFSCLFVVFNYGSFVLLTSSSHNLSSSCILMFISFLNSLFIWLSIKLSTLIIYFYYILYVCFYHLSFTLTLSSTFIIAFIKPLQLVWDRV